MKSNLNLVNATTSNEQNDLLHCFVEDESDRKGESTPCILYNGIG